MFFKYKFPSFFSILATFSPVDPIRLKTNVRLLDNPIHMPKKNLLIVFLLATCIAASARQLPLHTEDNWSGFSGVDVKKTIRGKACNSEFALNAEPTFSYVMTDAPHTPERFHQLFKDLQETSSGVSENASIHYISTRFIGITFLPNYIIEKGKRIQLYRSFGGDDYEKLEFSAIQRHRLIRHWTSLSTLGEDKEHVFLGSKTLDHKTVTQKWKRTYFAGNFRLAVGDTLYIMVRNIASRKLIKTITIVRPEDKANNFIFYQLPLKGEQLSTNLQHILNYGSGIPEVYSGKVKDSFVKDYGKLGIIRFAGLRRNEVLQYAFENKLESWRSIYPVGPENAVYIVVENDLPAGKTKNIFLRYRSQAETIHKITVSVNNRPIQIPWGKVALFTIVLLLLGGVLFYIWSKRNKRKLEALKRRNEDTETRLSLLSGQLNPHFLFNSLHAIQGTINTSNPDKANAYISNVATFMRDVMDTGKKEFISLEEEIKIEKGYLQLEQERLAFSYTVDISADISASLIDFPPLLLQPVLENSIRHAFGKQFSSPNILIKIYSVASSLIIEVSDNGNTPWNSTAANEGHGLSLTRKRIAVYNEKLKSLPIQMQIKYQTGTGTITTFTFQNWL